MIAILLATVLAMHGGLAPETAPALAPDVHVEVLRLRARGIDADALQRELALRVPRARIVAHDAAPIAAGRMVFVDLQPGDGSQMFTLTVVTNDGRAYDRTITADASSSADDVVRLLAGNVANLVSAIEAGTATADRENVVIPVPEVAKAPCPACPEPPPRLPIEPVATPPAVPPPPMVEIGVSVAPVVAIGLGAPSDADRFLGSGGGLGLWLRHRNGLLVGTEVRALGRRVPFDAAIFRTRIVASLGYAWRRGQFELATTGSIVVEPWWVRAGGEVTDLGDPDGGARRRRPLVGGGVSMVPAHHFALRNVGVRVGPRLDLTASSAIGDRGRVASVVVNDAGRLRTIGRLGGWELGFGVDVMVWIPARRRAP